MIKGDKFVTMDHFTEVQGQMEIDPEQQKARMKSVNHKLDFLRKLPNVNKQFLEESMREFARGETGSSEEGQITSFLEGLKEGNGEKEA